MTITVNQIREARQTHFDMDFGYILSQCQCSHHKDILQTIWGCKIYIDDTAAGPAWSELVGLVEMKDPIGPSKMRFKNEGELVVEIWLQIHYNHVLN